MELRPMSRSVVMFTGQGAQSVGMGKDIADICPAAADVFKRADDILGIPLSTLCFEGPEEELTRTDIQQPAIFTTSVAIWTAVLDRNDGAASLLQASAGLSLGEYTALHAAGSLTFEDALRLVRRRGQLMQEAAEASPSGMVSILSKDTAAVLALCEEAAQGDVLVPANFNCPGQIVISGGKAACERAVDLAEKHGVRPVPLNVAGAFHSPLMASAGAKLGEILADTSFEMPRCPVICNVDAKVHTTPDSMRAKLTDQVTHPVRWQESIENLIKEGYDCFIEIGPGRILSSFMRKIDRKMKTINVSTADAIDLGDLLAPA